MRPDEITFLSALSGCAHGGLVEEGLWSFSKMERYRVKHSVKHYGCLVDLLGRAGRLEDAYIWSQMTRSLGRCWEHVEPTLILI